MKFNFKKVASVIASAVMLTGTIGFAAATSYPAPFVQGGSADGAVVVGSNAAPTDWAASVDISNDLSGRVSGTTTTTSSVTGEAKALASGSDFIYLADKTDQEVSIITDDDLPTVLASGTFTDDDGADTDYDQFIDIGDDAEFLFDDSDGDLDNPALHLEMPDSASATSFIYEWRVDFDNAIAFNASASESEELTIAGKSYTVGTATDSNTIVLLGGSDQKTINVGESLTMEVNGISYEVSLTGISDEATPKASLIVNGESETFTEGQTKEIIEGLDVFVRTVFRTGDNSGYVIVEMGSDKLTLEDGKKVEIGADNENVDGTYVTITGGVGACTSIEIAISADDNDNDHLLEGETFVDPVFGSVKVELANLPNAPDISDDKGTDGSVRRTIEFTRASDDCVNINLEEKNGGSLNQEFAEGTTSTELEDDDGRDILVLEGATISEDLYYIMNNGDNQHFVQLDDISFDATDGISLVLQDMSGVKDDYDMDDETDLKNTGDIVQKNIWGQTYTIRLVSNATPSVQIYTSGYLVADADGTAKYLFPYIETISGKDHRVAFTEDVTEVLNDWVADDTTGNDATIELPTGSAVITESGTNGSIIVTESGASSGTTIATGADAGVDIGTVTYVFAVTAGTGTNAIDLEVGIGISQNGSTDVMEDDAGFLFVEEEDNSDSDNKNAVIIPTTAGATYADVDNSNIVFTNSEADTGETFDDSDFQGNIDPFGVYVVEDGSDTDQDFALMTYPENQMYAEVFVSEVGAVITPGGGGGSGGLIQVFNDKETSKFQDKNLLVVGGSCINIAAAKILDSNVPMCGAAWTEKTGVGAGQYIIKTVVSPYNEDKIAMLVAGYEATDTLNAVAKAKEGASTDVGSEEIYPKLSA